MARMTDQTGHMPFPIQRPQPAWAQVLDAAPNGGGLNMSAQLQEITSRRHRLNLIRCTSVPCSALSPSRSWPVTGKEQDVGMLPGD